MNVAGTRDSQVQLLKGDSGWVRHLEGGVVYSLDVTRCMFSSGNVTERTRMGKLAASGETVVDLFAGIGYYTLPLLVRAGELRCVCNILCRTEDVRPYLAILDPVSAIAD